MRLALPLLAQSYMTTRLVGTPRSPKSLRSDSAADIALAKRAPIQYAQSRRRSESKGFTLTPQITAVEAIPGEVARNHRLDRSSERGQMLKIQRSSNGQVVFTLSGQIDEEHIAELEKYIRAEANVQSIVLDLKDVTLAGRDAVSFLEHCEAEGVTLRNCAAYVREWITRQRRGR
jgi:hypothetical protein